MTGAEAQLRLLPWRLVAAIFAVFAVCVGASVAALGPAAAPGAMAGVLVGFFGTLFGDRRRSALAIVVVALATAASATAPDWARFVVVAPALSILTGWEAARSGTRAAVFAAMAWILLHAPAADGAGAPLFVAFGCSAVLGLVSALRFGVEGRAARDAAGLVYGIMLGTAMAIGLALAFLIAQRFDSSHSQWIALMFVARGLDPPREHARGALRTGLGAAAGAGAAGAALALPLPAWAFASAAVVLLLSGLRLLPAGTPLSPALISGAIILGVAPSPDSALFRAEAAAIAAGLAVALSFGVGRLTRAVMGFREGR